MESLWWAHVPHVHKSMEQYPSPPRFESKPHTFWPFEHQMYPRVCVASTQALDRCRIFSFARSNSKSCCKHPMALEVEPLQWLA
eukprot:6102638-Amphidinium_carterae.1